jgi:hypothetical protein
MVAFRYEIELRYNNIGEAMQKCKDTSEILMDDLDGEIVTMGEILDNTVVHTFHILEFLIKKGSLYSPVVLNKFIQNILINED